MPTPNLPIENLSSLYVQGGRLVRTGNTTITIASGQFRDSTDTNDIVISSLLTVNGANNGANGLDFGALANSTFYAVFAIGSSIFGGNSASDTYLAPAGLLSTSATAPILPAGYDMFRRIGYVLTDGSAHILDFIQRGNSNDRPMTYAAGISVLGATAAAAFTAQSLAIAVPPLATTVTLQATLVPNAPANFVALRPTGNTSAAGMAKLSGAVAAVAQIADMTVPCNATPSIDWLTDAASTVALTVASYVDQI